MKRKGDTPDEYTDNLEGGHRDTVEAIRGLARDELTGFDEAIHWGMIGYRQGDAEPAVALAAQKHYVSLYLLELGKHEDRLARHQAELDALNMGKGCIRFRPGRELPEDLIRGLLRDSIS